MADVSCLISYRIREVLVRLVHNTRSLQTTMNKTTRWLLFAVVGLLAATVDAWNPSRLLSARRPRSVVGSTSSCGGGRTTSWCRTAARIATRTSRPSRLVAFSFRIPSSESEKSKGTDDKDRRKKKGARGGDKKSKDPSTSAPSSEDEGGGIPIISGLLSRFSSPSEEEGDEKEEGEDEEDGGPTGFFRGLFRRGDEEEAARVESDKLRRKAEKVIKQEIQSQKKEQEKRKRAIEKKLAKRRKEQEKRRKQEEQQLASDDDDESWGSRVTSFFTSNPLFNSTGEDAGKENAEAQKRKGGGSTLSVVQKFLFDRSSSKPPENWVVVFPKTRIMPGEMVPVTVAGLDLLVIASRDGRRLYCIANACPHLGTPLETGQLVRLPVEMTNRTTADLATPFGQPPKALTELDVANLLSQDGCEDCVVCPTHRTAFALESGDVRGEWCPYPPVLGKLMGTVKAPVGAATFDVRTRGKNVEVRINTPLADPADIPVDDRGKADKPK